MSALKKWVMPAVFGAFVVAAVLLSALGNVQTTDGGMLFTYQAALFGPAIVTGVIQGQTTTISVDPPIGPSVFVLVGWILMVLGLVCGLVTAFVGEKMFKNAKVAKIVVLCSACLVLVGGIFQFFEIRSFAGAIAKSLGRENVDDIYEMLKADGTKAPAFVVSGILSIFGSLALAAKEFLPEK